jgi:LPS-assembly lipoprotein
MGIFCFRTTSCLVYRDFIAAIKTGLMPLLACVMLTSCGFHLRGTAEQELRIPALHLTAENLYGELIYALERTLSSSGTQLVDSRDLAPWTLSILSERLSRRVAATTRGISVAKYELILEVRFSLTARDGTLLTPPTSLSTQRTYEYDSSNLVGSDAEEELLRQEMRREIAESIIRRMGTTINSQAAM